MRWLLLSSSLLMLAACRTECRTKNAGVVPATPADGPVTCPLVLPDDTRADARAACQFGAGAFAEETLGIPREVATALPIRHVIVVMRENRSFDHLLGQLHDQGQPDTEAAPADFTNPDPSGKAVARFHAKSTCEKLNADHQWSGMHDGVNGGAMDGFVKNAAASTWTDGHFVMSYYDETDLPFETWLARTWALDDRHFASVRSGTFPNRDFLVLATNDGVKQTGESRPKQATPTLFQALEAAGATWAVYSDGELLSGSLGWNHDHAGCGCLTDFYSLLDSGQLPNVVFVDGRPDHDDDHPPADLQRGEAWMHELYTHLVASPQWPRTALLWTYDEGGGFADHVPPPNACVARPGSLDAPYFELGVRVPFVVVSPWARPHAVSHVVQEHTAITRFIETLFGLPALTARDANSPALLDLFDFSSCEPPMLHPPDAPDAGTGGCR